jgi:hypothetical protein
MVLDWRHHFVVQPGVCSGCVAHGALLGVGQLRLNLECDDLAP